MARFEPAIARVLEEEGGYIHDPDDPGGETNFGISKRFLLSEGIARQHDLKTMTRDEAVELYREYFWDRYRVGEIDSQVIAEKHFSFVVNMGFGAASRVLQRALRSVGITVKQDGSAGPVTRAAVNRSTEGNSSLPLLAAIRSEAAGFYRVLVAKDPVRKKWESGWLNRAYS